jgi:putative ABC transport system permease protein
VRDARYRSMREAILPTAYVPLHSRGDDGALQPIGNASIIVRTAGENPLQLAPMLLQEVPRVRPEFRVSRIRTQRKLMIRTPYGNGCWQCWRDSSPRLR